MLQRIWPVAASMPLSRVENVPPLCSIVLSAIRTGPEAAVDLDETGCPKERAQPDSTPMSTMSIAALSKTEGNKDADECGEDVV